MKKEPVEVHVINVKMYPITVIQLHGVVTGLLQLALCRIMSYTQNSPSLMYANYSQSSAPLDAVFIFVALGIHSCYNVQVYTSKVRLGCETSQSHINMYKGYWTPT